MINPQDNHWVPDCHPPSFFLLCSRLVWARTAAEIQGDGEDICQHRVQVLQLQCPPTVSTCQSRALGLDMGVGSLSAQIMSYAPPCLPMEPGTLSGTE